MRARRNPHRVIAIWLIAVGLALIGLIGTARYLEQEALRDGPPPTRSEQEAAPGRPGGSDGQGVPGRSSPGDGSSGEPNGAADGVDGAAVPALEMEGVEVVGRAQGETQWRLQGARIAQAEADGGLVTFEDVQRATLYQADGSTFHVHADAGLWDTSHDDLEFSGDVALTWHEAADRGGEGGQGVEGTALRAPENGRSGPRLWTEGLQKVRLKADAGRLQFVGPFQLVWKVGDGA